MKPAYLIITQHHGKIHAHIQYRDHRYYKLNAGLFNIVDRIRISDKDSQKPIDDLIILYSQKKLISIPEEEIEIPKTDEAKAKRIETLIGIIKTSNFEGEILEARTAYLKLTGRPYIEPDTNPNRSRII